MVKMQEWAYSFYSALVNLRRSALAAPQFLVSGPYSQAVLKKSDEEFQGKNFSFSG